MSCDVHLIRLLRASLAGMGRMYASQGFQQRDNYASTYAAKNVKSALDKLIDVLQSPAQVRRLVIGHASRRSPPTKPSKISFEAPARTPMWMETSASVAKHGHSADSEKTTTSSSSDNPPGKRKTRSAGGSRTSDYNDCGPCPPGCPLSQCTKFSCSSCQFQQLIQLGLMRALTHADMPPLAHLLCESEGKYVSLGRYHQMWARSLREYPAGGNVRPVPARYRQRGGPPPVEAGWSSVPCKPGYIEDLTVESMTTRLTNENLS